MLTEKLEQYRKAQELADELAAEIKAEVIKLGKSQSVDGVTATYRKGVAKVDYKAAADALDVDIAGYESVKVDFTKAVKAAELDPEKLAPFTIVGEPSVSLKLA